MTNHFAVRPDYGDVASLRALVAAAHSLGLRVILDMPLNDTSSEHPYFVQAKDYKEASHYWDFYERAAHGKPVHEFNWSKLPNLEYSNEEVQRLALEAGVFWIEEADIDGYRLDAAWAVQQRTPGFWQRWTEEVRRVKPDVMLLAEASAREGVWAQQDFTLAYDWTTSPGEWAWSTVFAKKTVDIAALQTAIGTPEATTPLRFLENNDTGKRFITDHGAAMTRAAAALLLSLPGRPADLHRPGDRRRIRTVPPDLPAGLGLRPLRAEPALRAADRRTGEQPELAEGPLRPASSAPAGVAAFTAGSILVAVNFSASQASGQVVPAEGEAVAVDLAPWEWSRVQLA